MAKEKRFHVFGNEFVGYYVKDMVANKLGKGHSFDFKYEAAWFCRLLNKEHEEKAKARKARRAARIGGDIKQLNANAALLHKIGGGQ